MRLAGCGAVLAAACIAGSLIAPRDVQAQASTGTSSSTLTGTLTDPEGKLLTAPSVLVLLDEQQVERARLVAAGGRFSMSLPAGRYRLRVLRVGFAPFDAGDVTVSDNGTPVSIQWRGAPVALPEVVTRERQSCDLTRTRGAALALVWEQIGTALGVTDAAPATPREFERYAFVRRLDPEARVVRGIHQARTRGTSITSYRAWEADSLALHGYLREDATGSTFYAPTASTLLSPSFLRSHCFELVDRPDGDRERLVVRFEPASQRERVVDIAGSFWVDRRTARLDSVQFRYVGLPAFVSAEQARGSVHFAQLSDGSWFVSQWTLRMPRIGERERRSSDNLRRTTFALEDRAVTEVQEEGGVVLAAEAPGVEIYRTILPTVRVRLDARAAWLPLARVQVKDTDIDAPVDSAGRVVMPLPRGRYDLTLRFPFGDAEPWPLATAIATRGDAADDRVRPPNGEQLLKHLCGAEPGRLRQAAIWGVVTDSVGTPLAGVTVTARWVTSVRLPSAQRGDRLSATTHDARSVTGTGGYFLLCGVPRTQFVVEATAGEPSAPWQGRVSVYLDEASRFEPAGLVVLRPAQPGSHY